MAVNIPIKTTGGDQAVADLNKVGEAGSRALDRIKQGTQPASAGLKVLNEITSDLKGRLGGLSDHAGIVGSALSKIGPGGFVAAAGIGAIALGAFKLGESVHHALEFADSIAKLSEKTGIGVQTLTSYGLAADLAGTNIDGLATGMKKLSKNMLETASGTGTAKDAFALMGISVKDSSGHLKDVDDVLLNVADKFSSYKDGAEKAALAQQIFGKAGADLIPLLNQGAAGLRAERQEAEQLGIIFDEKTAKAAERFNDNMTRLKAASGAVGTQLMASLAGPLSQISRSTTPLANYSATARRSRRRSRPSTSSTPHSRLPPTRQRAWG